jgi:hypothetical protein
MSLGPKWWAAWVLRPELIAPKPIPNSRHPPAKTHSDHARASRASAPAITTVPTVTNSDAGSRVISCPVTTLETTDAAVPTISRMPRAPTGACRSSRADGHNMPNVEPGKATKT